MAGQDKKRASLEGLRNVVQDGYRRLSTTRIVAITFSVFSVLLALLFILLVIEYFQYLSPGLKTTFWIILLGTGIGLFILLSKKLKKLPFNAFYNDLSRSARNNSIRYLLDFEHYKRNKDTSLHEAAITQNLQNISVEGISGQLKQYHQSHVYRKLHNYSLIGFFALTILIAGTGAFSPDAIKRTVLFWEYFEKPLPFTYEIIPGNSVVAQGEAFQARVIFGEGRIPESITLGIKTAIESEFRYRPMRLDEDGTYISEGLELYNNAEYYIQMDGHESETFTAEIQLLPRFSSLTATIVPPAYTGLKNTRVSYPFSRLDIYPGSELILEAKPNKALIQNELIRHINGDTLTLRVNEDNIASQKLNINERDSLSFYLEDEYGLINSNPFSFTIPLLTDQYPSVFILSPDREISLRNPDSLQIAYELEDDFGFTEVTLNYKLNKAYVENPVTGSVQLTVPKGKTGFDRYNWDVSNLNLGSLDRLEYWIEVTDNDEVSGFKSTRSESHYVNMQSFADQVFEHEERENQIESSFENVQDIYRQMQENFQRFREQVQIDPDASWEQSEILDDIKDQREELNRQVEDLKEKFDELTRDIEDTQMLSDETLRQYKELNELIEEIDDPEILKLLEQLQENLNNFDQSEIRKALEEIEFNESSYRERLERTVELFKTLRMNAELDKMAELLKDLEHQEQQLMNQDEIGDEQIQQQESIKEQLEEISRKLDELPEKGPNRRKERLERLREEMRPEMDAMGEKLQENIEDMQQENPDQEKIKQDQDQLQQQMGEMAEKLAEARQDMNQEQIQVNITALRNILQSLILLSEAQEEVTLQTSELSHNSSGFVAQARNQRNINRNFDFLADSLYRVSTEIPGFSNRINQRKLEIQYTMQRAVDYLVERHPGNATIQERTALGGLNELGSMLADLLDQLNEQDQGDGGGMSAEQMMEQLQNMSGEQQELNQQIQEMINDMAGERLSQDQMERLNQMARQQNEIRRQMRELQRSGGFRGGDRILSEMERLGEEMENAINELRGGQLDEMMVERQQNILSRMLEAEKAIEQRDQDEERRRGETAEEYERSSPPELTIEELRRQIRSGINEEEQTRFNPDYQQLIERYFELLEDMLERQGR